METIDLTIFEVIIACIVVCIVLSLLVQSIWALIHITRERPNILRIIQGSTVAGLFAGVALGLMMLYFLPTVYIVEKNDYTSHRFISKDWPKQLTNRYINNRSGGKLLLVAVGYGSDKNINEKKIINQGELFECDYEIDGYNEEPPSSISSKNSGETKWYLFSHN